MSKFSDGSYDEIIYIIVVHGIGEQRKNESLLPVINGFAHVCECINHKKGRDLDLRRPLTQGRLSKSDDVPWFEFDGIPSSPENCSGQRFVGKPVNTLGKNIRFVDMYWADVMQEHFDECGESVESWTKSLIDRLEIKKRNVEKNSSVEKDSSTEKKNKTIISLLESIRKSVLPIKHILSLAALTRAGTQHKLNDEVFNRFLGDAQLYGEHSITRGKAIRRFHDKMHELHEAHCKSFEEKPIRPRYVVLAHSLGSIMSFDSLIFAHGKIDDKNKYHNSLDIKLIEEKTSLRGYQSKQELESPSVDWVRFVDTFITLGSPIDKYLLIWSENYEHLYENKGEGCWFNSEECRGRDSKIKHFNYCDELDPVGHELNTAYDRKVVNNVFSKEDDALFMRYKIPGKAHVDYWKDIPLLRRIVMLAVHDKPDNKFVFDIFKKDAYWSALNWSYLYVPFLGALIFTPFVVLLFYKLSNFVYFMPLILALFLAFVWMLYNIKLMVNWRQVSMNQMFTSEKTSRLVYKPEDKVAREKIRDLYVRFLHVISLLSVVPIVSAMIALLSEKLDFGATHYVFLSSMSVLFVGLFILDFCFHEKNVDSEEHYLKTNLQDTRIVNKSGFLIISVVFCFVLIIAILFSVSLFSNGHQWLSSLSMPVDSGSSVLLVWLSSLLFSLSLFTTATVMYWNKAKYELFNKKDTVLQRMFYFFSKKR